jgi:hypothetical protein
VPDLRHRHLGDAGRNADRLPLGRCSRGSTGRTRKS